MARNSGSVLWIAIFAVNLVIGAAMLLDVPEDSDAVSKRSSCVDNKEKCVGWKKYCTDQKYLSWMRKNCAKTCRLCVSKAKPTATTSCTDKRGTRKCTGWKSYCAEASYSVWMKENCARTCRACESSKTKPTATTGSSDLVQECLQAHNTLRAKHGARPLRWDSELARKAQAFADKLARENAFHHDRSSDDGENLARAWGQRYTCKDAVKDWYSEEKLYPFSNPPRYLKGGYGHFTQVVWKSSKRLGVGIARKGSSTFIVARYSPAGNVGGQFAANVGAR